jgi:hypothetical protein
MKARVEGREKLIVTGWKNKRDEKGKKKKI